MVPVVVGIQTVPSPSQACVMIRNEKQERQCYLQETVLSAVFEN